MCEINDVRMIGDFKGITFSKYKKSDVKKELLNSFNEGKIESACYWSGELICAGHYLDLWESIITFVGKFIHLGNPHLPRYISMRYENFKDIINDGFTENPLVLRNQKKIRILFAEMVTIVCLSTKKHPYTTIKIKKTDFETIHLTDRLKADNVNYAKPVFRSEDPNELFIATNEFMYHLKKTKNVAMCWFWMEWMIEFEAMLKREKKQKLVCATRDFTDVEHKLKKDMIWIIWDCMIRVSIDYKDKTDIVKALMHLFAIRFKPGVKKKRRFLLYFATSILTETYVNKSICNNEEKKKIELIKEKIDVIYTQIKKNEIKPKTDYLFNNSINEKAKNLEKSMNKLNKLDNLLGSFPRK